MTLTLIHDQASKAAQLNQNIDLMFQIGFVWKTYHIPQAHGKIWAAVVENQVPSDR